MGLLEPLPWARCPGAHACPHAPNHKAASTIAPVHRIPREPVRFIKLTSQAVSPSQARAKTSRLLPEPHLSKSPRASSHVQRGAIPPCPKGDIQDPSLVVSTLSRPSSCRTMKPVAPSSSEPGVRAQSTHPWRRQHSWPRTESTTPPEPQPVLYDHPR